MLDLGAILDGSVAVPFGLGHIPLWALLAWDGFGLIVMIKIILRLARRVKGKHHSKPDYNKLAARGSILGGFGQVASTIVALCAVIVTIWIWQEQAAQAAGQRLEEARLQAQQRLEEVRLQEQQRQEDKMHGHALFVARVSVISYSDPGGVKIVVRNANPVNTSVLVLSLVGKKKKRQNVEVVTPPCTQASFVMKAPTSWTPVVRKGGYDWFPAADPSLLQKSWIFDTYGSADGKIYSVRAPAIHESISCSS
ncbi:hypothetical protein ABZU75_04460 [Streptosporangium sp. NPDC005286]|uniref:hypothetical protein n=1 Tax=Streptosporangium sp. NPDC005286 TaxID=3154463 RepID=UPI0033BECF3D